MGSLPSTVIPPLAAQLAAQPLVWSATSDTRSQSLHLASSKLMAFAIVGSAWGSPGEGIVGPPAHMIAFHASHSNPVGLADFCFRGASDQNRFFEVAVVDAVSVANPLCLRLSVAAGSGRAILARGIGSGIAASQPGSCGAFPIPQRCCSSCW